MRELALISVLILMTACSSPPNRPAVTVSAVHAVHDHRLRELMAEISRLILSEKEMTEHQRDIKRRQFNRRMAESAEAMGNNVESILTTLPRLKLSLPEQATFRTQADKLRNEAQRLQELAGNNNSDAIAGQLERIDATCKACHRLFRATGG